MSSTSPVESRGQPSRIKVVQRTADKITEFLAAQNSSSAEKPQDPPVRPKVVVSEKGLNFIQDQKEFVESKQASESAGTSGIKAERIFFSQFRYATKETLLKKPQHSPYLRIPHSNSLAALSPTTSGSVPKSPNAGAVKKFRVLMLAQGLSRPTKLVSMDDLPPMAPGNNQNLDSGSMSPSNRSITSRPPSNIDSKIRVSQNVKDRLASLFKDKKSLSKQPDMEISSLHHLKKAVQDALQQETTAPEPSQYLQRVVTQLATKVKREEKRIATKQKLQQVLSKDISWEHFRTEEAEILQSLKPPCVSENCQKEQIEIQKIQKLQVHHRKQYELEKKKLSLPHLPSIGDQTEIMHQKRKSISKLVDVEEIQSQFYEVLGRIRSPLDRTGAPTTMNIKTLPITRKESQEIAIFRSTGAGRSLKFGPVVPKSPAIPDSPTMKLKVARPAVSRSSQSADKACLELMQTEGFSSKRTEQSIRDCLVVQTNVPKVVVGDAPATILLKMAPKHSFSERRMTTSSRVIGRGSVQFGGWFAAAAADSPSKIKPIGA